MTKDLNTTYINKITGDAVAAVAVILLNGPGAEKLLLQNWKSIRSIKSFPRNRILYGHWGGVELQGKATEDVVVCRVEEHAFEIHCHGGHAASTKIIGDLVASGAVESSELIPSELIKPSRPSQAAMKLLPLASTQNVARVFLNQANVAIENEIRSILVQSSTAEQRKESLKNLIDRSVIGLRLLNPPSVAILGPPNAGKSTLLNTLLGWERAIVHSTPGTTRDVLQEEISLEGWPLFILDTAGLRVTADEIESQGIAKARRAAVLTDLVLLTVDPQEGWTALHDEIADQFSEKVLVVRTKTDLLASSQNSQSSIPGSFPCASVCALTSEGINELITTIVDRLGFSRSLMQGAVPFLPEQVELLMKALAAADDPFACREILEPMISEEKH